MKRIFSSFVLLSMIISCVGVASAADMQQPRASLTLSRYSAVISAGDGSGEVIIGYECFILGKHTARNGVAGISPPRREFQKC